jgi:hypothetical protein
MFQCLIIYVPLCKPKENHKVRSCHAADDDGMPPPLINMDANDGDNALSTLINLIAAVAAAC